MADPKTDQTPTTTPSAGASADKPAASADKPASRASRRPNPEAGLKDEVQALHQARTEVPSRPGADARLDNRSAEQLAGGNEPKPQHVDGPDAAGQVEHTRAVLAAKSAKG